MYVQQQQQGGLPQQPPATASQQQQMLHAQQQQQQRAYPTAYSQNPQMTAQMQQQQYNQMNTNPELAKHPIQDRMKNIMPAPLDFNVLNNLDTMPVPQLCQLGREIVQDITIRAMNVLSFFKMGAANRRNGPAFDIEAILAYSKFLFQKLQEIRIRVDKARMEHKCESMSEDAFFDAITNPEPVEDEESSTKHALTEQLEGNRTKIVEMSNKIKKLEWFSATIDPRN